MNEQKKAKGFFSKLHDKYRIVVMNNETLEEKLSVRLSRFNVFLALGLIGLLLITGTIYLIAFTPLREYIPGYADFNTRQVLRELSLRADSLERDLRQKDLFIMNIRNIVEGRDMIEELHDSVGSPARYIIDELPRSREDSLLRAEMEEAQQLENNFWVRQEASYARQTDHFTFFTPLSGMISSHFNPRTGHFGVDIVADHNEIISAALDGTVIIATWTLETGYTIGIQHAYNIITVYKHNSRLLKSQGDFVQAGEAIAVIGDTGAYSTGTHLHFELWFNGIPVNPVDYIAFQ